MDRIWSADDLTRKCSECIELPADYWQARAIYYLHFSCPGKISVTSYIEYQDLVYDLINRFLHDAQLDLAKGTIKIRASRYSLQYEDLSEADYRIYHLPIPGKLEVADATNEIDFELEEEMSLFSIYQNLKHIYTLQGDLPMGILEGVHLQEKILHYRQKISAP